MEKQKKSTKKHSGFCLTVLISIGFIVVKVLITSVFSEPSNQYLADSIVRVIFGVLALVLLVKCFDRDFCPRTIHGRNIGAAVLADAAAIVFIGILAVILFTHTTEADWQEFRAVPGKLLFARLIAQQLTTGFFEEVTYRGLLLEGYFQSSEKTVSARLLYGSLSFFVFGALHIIGGGGLERFILTGIFGLSMAAVYLHSGNLLMPMVLHFLHDLLAHTCSMFTYEGTNLQSLVLGGTRIVIILAVLAVVWAVVFLILPPASANRSKATLKENI